MPVKRSRDDADRKQPAKKLASSLTSFFSELPTEQRTTFPVFISGNEPCIDLKDYVGASDKTTILIGCSGARSIDLACQLAKNQAQIPQIFIIDISDPTIQFWRCIQDLAGKNLSEKVFFKGLQRFLVDNKALLPPETIQLLLQGTGTNVVGQVNQHPIGYFAQLFADHDYERVLEVIKHATVIAGDWTNSALFSELKKEISQQFKNFDLVLYPSNIIACYNQTQNIRQRDLVLHNIRTLAPNIIIYTSSSARGLPPQHYMVVQEYNKDDVLQFLALTDRDQSITKSKIDKEDLQQVAGNSRCLLM